MKKQRTILTYLGVWWRAACLRATHRQACWCGLVVGLTLACGAAMAELIPITLEHDSTVNSVSFSPDGTLLATSSYFWDKDQKKYIVSEARVWEMPSGRLLATLEHDDYISSVSFSPDGTLLATDEAVWEVHSGKLLATLGSVNAVAFSPDGTLLATASSDDTAKVWEMPEGSLLATLEHDGEVNAVVFSPDGMLLATASHDRTIKVWEMPGGRLLATLEHNDRVFGVVLNSDGTLLATRFDYKTAKVWKMPEGSLLATLKHGNMRHVTFSPDGKLWVTSGSAYDAKVWEMPSGKLLVTLEHDRSLSDVTFNSDGTLLATASFDDIVKVWEMPSGRLLATLEHARYVTFSPDGKLLVTQFPVDKANPPKVWRTKVWVPHTDDAPTLTEPSDGSEFANTLPELKWERVPNDFLYQVQVATDKDFSRVALEEVFIDTESLKIDMGKLAPGTYFWQVRTVGWSNFGEWSEVWSFIVDFPQNIVSAPTLNVTRTDFDFEMKGLKNITIEIKIDKAQNLYGFQFDLQFDPNVLEAIKVTEGDFLKSIGGNTSFMKPSIDNSAGIIKSVVASRMSPGEVSGSGVLAKVEFNFKKAGTSLITFPLIKLSNEQFQSIDYAYVNGSATLNITPTTPSAKIQVQPSIVDNQVMAKVLIENAVNLRGYSVDLEYPSALELLDVSQGDFLKEGWQQTTPSANTVRFSASKAKGELVEGSGEIATLTFRIWEGGEQPFTLKNGTLTAPVVTNIYTPELQGSAITVVASPNWEVNKDYVVDMQDIVILGINFDKKITGNPRPNPDVTRDELVDIFDLVAVASHYADEYSAVPQPLASPAIIKRAAHNLPAPTSAQLWSSFTVIVSSYSNGSSLRTSLGRSSRRR